MHPYNKHITFNTEHSVLDLLKRIREALRDDASMNHALVCYVWETGDPEDMIRYLASAFLDNDIDPVGVITRSEPQTTNT